MADEHDPQAVLIAYAQSLTHRFSSELRAAVFHDEHDEFHALLFAILKHAQLYQVYQEHGEETSDVLAQFTSFCETLYLVGFHDGQAQAHMKLPQVE
jgi:hypothetical protein